MAIRAREKISRKADDIILIAGSFSGYDSHFLSLLFECANECANAAFLILRFGAQMKPLA